MLRGPPRQARDGTKARAEAEGAVSASPADGKFFGKNTIDLQWKMRANYNARPCEDERKVASAKNNGNKGKNNAQTIETVRNLGGAYVRS